MNNIANHTDIGMIIGIVALCICWVWFICKIQYIPKKKKDLDVDLSKSDRIEVK